MSVIAVTDPNELRLLLKRHPFLRPGTTLGAPSLGRHWITEFCDAYGHLRQVFAVVVYEAGRPQLVAPLQVVSSTAAVFLCGDGSDHNDLLWSTPDIQVLEQALRFMAGRGLRALLLSRMPSDTDTIRLFREIKGSIAVFISVEQGEASPYVECKKNMAIDRWPGVDVSRIKYLQRKRSALEQKYTCRFRILDDAKEIEVVLPVLFEIHRKRWHQRGIVSKFADENRSAFTRAICTSALTRGELFLAILEIAGHVIAYTIGFRCGETIFDWNSCFDITWGRWSPGALLQLDILERCEEFGISTYDMLRGTESYKFDWTSKTRGNCTIFCSLEEHQNH